MKETVYLIVTRQRVERMVKNLPQLHRGEFPVKVVVTVEESAFREPVIERQVTVVDWREGLDFADVDLTEATITEVEAEMIRQQRLAQMRRALEERGFMVVAPIVDDDSGGEAIE